MPPRFYFAYGSNMSTERLRARIESAEPVGRAHWQHMELAFNKVGVDGSGKANLMARPGARAWGVLFDLHPDDWGILDRYEPGYTRSTCNVSVDSGRVIEAQVYLAVPPLSAMPPQDWYRDHLLRGAEEHALPDDIVELIRALECL